MAYMKDSFESWLATLQRSNGEPYAQATITNYVRAIKGFCAKLKDIAIPNTDLFTIDSLEQFDRTHTIINAHPDFKALNDSFNRSFSSGLLMYRRFLEETYAHENNEKKFIAWMQNYREPKYRDSTINRYITALKRAEERLEITLSKPIFSVCDTATFDELVQEIRNCPQYEFVNKKFGNGDLSAALNAYGKYIKSIEASNSDWWPSLKEYNPRISTAKWLEMLNNPDILGENIRRMFASMYAQGGATTCAQLAELYGKTANHYIMTAVHAAENVVKATNCPLMQDQENSKLWPVFFVGRNEPKTDRYIWKIRDELYDALTEYGIAKYLEEETTQGGEKEMTIKEKVAAIKAYIAARGFNYEGDLIENFYLSLKSKPFVILAGTSGTGKTRLVKLFAEAIGAKMKLVPVRPDWSDSSDLFGHTDLSNQFHPGAIIDFIKQAEWDKSTPHFLCLDEMNLARVEYYLSGFLSIIETRDRKDNGAIETDALVDTSFFQTQSAREKYGRVYIPENLYIIGTVNMDETTFPFSKKVLDRANTIEFSFVNLIAKATAGGQAVAQKLDNSFLKTEYLYLRDCDDEDLIDTVCFNLEELNQILVKANLHVGYRVRDEISFYMMNNKKAELLDKDAAFDHEIMQKILPRVQGSSAAIKDVLSELFIKCAGDYAGLPGAAAYEQMNAYFGSKSCKYPNSAKKIAFMMRRYEEDGFTSYWL